MRYNAGSEVYSQTLCQGLADRHQVHVFTRKKNPLAPHFWLRKVQVAEDPRVVLHVVNNPRFKDRYRSNGIDRCFGEVLDLLQPHVAHIGHLDDLST